ncbi:ABC transporter ATP-binding protein [Lederbergia wuyishanensis]|uniref:Peptide/nickel transport system ATP-binding protein n=1 Tax=Lederbergia wuyishanensis TaxID=1347903 RepID=A0ABU0D9N4_9BACI|nr:ABC transporter ATP-binding protein [Lederbergia wuyishanensis]MCJ8007520.1 ABC transporter ATP-binding protein [Lederbergia wuyishanensis]MDQ0345040.1 peptide/nickel transport system ATP-binding protein [Lederbergia wuyishanensis]
MEENLVEIRNLSVEFKLKRGTIRAVDNVSLDIPKGKVTALVGESGSGKSTLASAILKMVSSPGVISNGSINMNGENILKMKQRALQQYRWSNVSMVFQAAQNSLNPVVKIKEQFIETYLAHKKAPEKEILAKAAQLLEYVRLEPKRVFESYPHELSGGMKQRVMIAFSLLLDPDLVILDEPTTALDVITQDYIFDILLKIHEELAITMLLLSHDISVVAKVADRIGVMYAGKLVEVGDIFEIFTNSKHPYTAGLIKAAPSLLEDLEHTVPIGGSPPDLLNLPSGCAFHPRCQFAKDICKQVTPPMEDVGENHLTACHLHHAVEMGSVN